MQLDHAGGLVEPTLRDVLHHRIGSYGIRSDEKTSS